MVEDGNEARPATCWPDPARDRQDQGHHGRPAARGGAVRSPPAQRAGGHRVDGVVKYGDVAKQHRKIFVTGDDNEAHEYQLPRQGPSTCRRVSG